jgi:putative adhesin
MRSLVAIAFTVIVHALCASPALAQRYPFDRTFETAAAPTLDVTTIRGKIEVVAGASGTLVVTGEVTVRVGMNVPLDAVNMAKSLAADPPVQAAGGTIQLRPPSDATVQRAVTVSYRVTVPPDTIVITSSDSGETSVRGVGGPVKVHTESSAIDLAQLGSTVEVTTGSGAVTVNDVKGALSVTTSSSAFTGRSLKGSLRVRTNSGAVDATLTGSGPVDAQTSSSGMRISGVSGGLTLKTESGRVIVDGEPAGSWTITTGSGSVDATLSGTAGANLDVATGSGSVMVEGLQVQGTVAKREVTGRIRGGGPVVHISTRSGSIRVRSGTTD